MFTTKPESGESMTKLVEGVADTKKPLPEIFAPKSLRLSGSKMAHVENSITPFGVKGFRNRHPTDYRNGYGENSSALNRRLKNKPKNRPCLGGLNS